MEPSAAAEENAMSARDAMGGPFVGWRNASTAKMMNDAACVYTRTLVSRSRRMYVVTSRNAAHSMGSASHHRRSGFWPRHAVAFTDVLLVDAGRSGGGAALCVSAVASRGRPTAVKAAGAANARPATK